MKRTRRPAQQFAFGIDHEGVRMHHLVYVNLDLAPSLFELLRDAVAANFKANLAPSGWRGAPPASAVLVARKPAEKGAARSNRLSSLKSRLASAIADGALVERVLVLECVDAYADVVPPDYTVLNCIMEIVSQSDDAVDPVAWAIRYREERTDRHCASLLSEFAFTPLEMMTSGDEVFEIFSRELEAQGVKIDPVALAKGDKAMLTAVERALRETARKLGLSSLSELTSDRRLLKRLN